MDDDLSDNHDNFIKIKHVAQCLIYFIYSNLFFNCPSFVQEAMFQRKDVTIIVLKPLLSMLFLLQGA